jgi:ATP-binding protein involved in chromosome partitioning
VTEDAVKGAMRGVIDPELGDNVVDLGMYQGAEVAGDGAVTVLLALTTAGCPLRTQLQRDSESRVGSLPGVTSVHVRTTEMNREAKSAVMARARWKAREDALPTDIPGTARVVAIASGKGGVGKSSITVNLAAVLADRGFTVGVLDADIAGFSVPRMLGIDADIQVAALSEEHGSDPGRPKMIPVEKVIGKGRLKVLSMGFLSPEDEAIMWRGLMLNRAVQHFLEDARWGDLDYLFVDMPPGTGDIQMGLARLLPRTEMIIVTTPTLAAQKVAVRAADMARKGYLRVVGVVENMSGFTCEHGEHYDLFGQGGGDRLAHDIGVPLLGRIPLQAAVSAGGDAGQPAALGSSEVAAAFGELADAVIEAMPVVEMAGCTARLLDQVETALGPPPG